MESLKKYNIQKYAAQYLQLARQYAKKSGYDPIKLEFSLRKEYKLMYDNRYHFGRTPYSDFLLYTILAQLKAAPKYTSQYAASRRESYLARSAEIPGNWKDDKFSANNLARKILWAE